MWHYLWWIPSVFIFYVIYYAISIRINQNPIYPWYKDNWLIFLFIYGALCPFWVIVSRTSQRIFIDGILYDQVMLLSYYITMIGYGQGIKFGWWQWIGIGFLFTGSVLIRIAKE